MIQRTLVLIALCLAIATTSSMAADAGSGLTVYASWYRPSTAAAYLYVRNNTAHALTLMHLRIDGAIEPDQPWPPQPNRKADWFDLLPATLEPGMLGQLRVHLHDLQNKQPVNLAIEASDGSRAQATVAPQAAPLNFADITFAKDGSAATLFVGSDVRIKSAWLDGNDVSAQCDLAGAAPFKGTAAVFYHPPTPLARGSYHTWEVRTDDGRRAIYTARTLANGFVIGSYGKRDLDPYKQDFVNLLMSFIMIPSASIAQISAAEMTCGVVPFVGGEVDAKTHQFVPLNIDATRANLESAKSDPGIAFFSAPDEPDGADSPLGVGVHARSIVAMRQLAAQIDPATPCFVQIDNTYRNSNYFIYAESMDYSASHRYNLGQDFLPGDRAGMAVLRDSAAPLPYLWVTQLYPIRQNDAEHSRYDGRDPAPAEMHIQMLEALGGGAKGFIHYIHSGSRGGRGGSGQNAQLWAAMGPMHQQIAAVGALAVRSTPVAWASSPDPRVHASALLCDPSDLLVVLTNNAIQSTKTEVQVPQINDVQVAVALPPWVRVDEALEVRVGGQTSPVQFDKDSSGTITAHVSSLAEGTILWLKGVQ